MGPLGDSTVMNGISALLKRTPESSLAPFAMWGHRKKMAIFKPGSGSHLTEPTGALILDSLASRNVKNKCLCLSTEPMVFCYISPRSLRHTHLICSPQEPYNVPAVMLAQISSSLTFSVYREWTQGTEGKSKLLKPT